MSNVDTPRLRLIKSPKDPRAIPWPNDKPIPDQHVDFDGWMLYILMTKPNLRDQMADLLVQRYLDGKIIIIE